MYVRYVPVVGGMLCVVDKLVAVSALRVFNERAEIFISFMLYRHCSHKTQHIIVSLYGCFIHRAYSTLQHVRFFFWDADNRANIHILEWSL